MTVIATVKGELSGGISLAVENMPVVNDWYEEEKRKDMIVTVKSARIGVKYKLKLYALIELNLGKAANTVKYAAPYIASTVINANPFVYAARQALWYAGLKDPLDLNILGTPICATAESLKWLVRMLLGLESNFDGDTL